MAMKTTTNHAVGNDGNADGVPGNRSCGRAEASSEFGCILQPETTVNGIL
jgi:hypothetical protein